MPSQFADYTSFLEVAFAINLLFGGWRGFARFLLERRQISLKRYVAKVRIDSVDEAMEQRARDRMAARHEKCGVLCRRVERIGRLLGVFMAIAIVVLLFLVGNAAPVDARMLALIVAAAMPVPTTMASMLLIQTAYRVWFWHSYRRFRKEARHLAVLVRAANEVLDSRADRHEDGGAATAPSLDAQRAAARPARLRRSIGRWLPVAVLLAAALVAVLAFAARAAA